MFLPASPGDETYLVPEDTQKDAPPSYSSAQADAVPPYWETTIHAPSSSNVAGEIIIDSLPTGSLFSFLWNMLVSISFQFVGFLLTYLLHTTHAAKLGSRAGLGVTMIQYGFALRGKSDVFEGEQTDSWNDWQQPAEPAPTFPTAAEAEAYYNNLNATAIVPPEGVYILGDAASEWLSFVLMTVGEHASTYARRTCADFGSCACARAGWFILLTSLLGFWRVKRWEQGILSSQHGAPQAQEPAQRAAVLRHIERVFGLQGLADGSLLRSGLGLHGPDAQGGEQPLNLDAGLVDEGAGQEGPEGYRPEFRPGIGEYIIPIDPSDPERNEVVARAFAEEARLHQELRAAGLL